jgi:hypothetical protein
MLPIAHIEKGALLRLATVKKSAVVLGYWKYLFMLCSLKYT